MNFRLLLFTTLLISFSGFSQEKRLALVIGNSNYEMGPLKNPVNDALLMAENLKALNFDVTLDTNIATIKEFNDVVRKFGEKRDNYNVGLIYYAGHGIQINDVNYLLATKEEYLSEFDVEDKALSVQKIMRYLTDRTDEVNVLILDACRNNPFEKNWTIVSRTTETSKGLAKISPPTGSLIAYSTDAGNTASDGDQKNSVYCLSLTKNMNVSDISLDQVFRNVRREVLTSSDGKQRPIEASQLTGSAFYLKKSTYTDQIKEIDSLIEINKFDLAREKTSAILTLDPTNKQALLRKGRIEYNTLGIKYDGKELFRASELYKNDQEVYLYISRYYSKIGNSEKAIVEINKALQIDSNYAEYFYWRARFHSELKNYSEAKEDFTQAIELEPTNANRYIARATFYNEDLNNLDSALIDFSKAISLNPEDTASLYNRGSIFYQLNQIPKALDDFNQILKINPSNVSAMNFMGLIYKDQGKLDLAILEFEKGIAYGKNDPESASYCHINRAEIFIMQKKYVEALNDYNNSILLTPKNADAHNYRGLFYMDYIQDYNNALIDFSKAIELDSNSIEFLYNRGILYSDYIHNTEKALVNFHKIITIDPSYVDAINYIGLIHIEKGEINQAIIQYNKGISLEKTNPESASFCYRNRAEIYANEGKMNEALDDYTKAIELNSLNPDRYIDRAFFHQDFAKDFNSALNDFSKAIEIEPNNIDHWYNRGNLLADYMQDYKKALDDYHIMLKLDENNIDAINSIGLIYWIQGKNDLAILEFNKAINLENQDKISLAPCYRNRASVFAEKGLYVEAISDFNKAIELDSENPYRYYDRANFYKEFINDYDNALIDYSKAIDLDQQNIDFYYARGNLYDDYLNQEDKAIKDFEKVLEIDSEHIDSRNVIGLIYQEQGKFDLALEEFNKGIAFEQSQPETSALCYRNRAVIYSNQEKFEEALSDYSKAIELNKLNPDGYVDRAYFYLDFLNDIDNALLDYSKALDLDPNSVTILYARSMLWFENLKNYNRAFNDLNKILEIDPNNIDAINLSGVIYEEQGKLDKAIEQYSIGILLNQITTESAAICYRNRAGIYAKKGDTTNALLDYTQAINISEAKADFFYSRGLFFQYDLFDYNRALIDYSISIQFDPENIDYLYARGLLYNDFLIDLERAKEDYKSIIEIDSMNIDAINALGTIFNDEKLLDSALYLFEKGLKSISDNLKAKIYCYYNKARIYSEKNSLDSALYFYNQAIELDSNDAESYYVRGLYFRNYTNDYIRALSDFSEAIKLNNADPLFYMERSLVYSKLNELNAQLKDINKAIELNPEEIDYHLERVLLFTQQNEYKKAEKEFELSKSMDSTHHNTFICMSKHYLLKGELENALSSLDKAYVLDPNDPEIFLYKAKIYERQGLNLFAIKNYSMCIGLLKANMGYSVSDEIGYPLETSEIHIYIGQFFEKQQEYKLMCEEYNQALTLLKDDYRYRFVKLREEIQEKINKYCK
jgi:tetratricopeptide (TPR) repeat protein